MAKKLLTKKKATSKKKEKKNDMRIMKYTDYPFVEMGDVPNTEAPIRLVEVFDYPFNDKYAYVLLPNRKIAIVKKGYLYNRKRRFDENKYDAF